MNTHLDCMACFVRQALDAVRRVTDDRSIHERILRDVLSWCSKLDLSLPPPVIGQRIHRRLRELSGNPDPYCQEKARQNRMAESLLAGLSQDEGLDLFERSVKLAIAGNIIDLGVSGCIDEPAIQQALVQALSEPIVGDLLAFRRAVQRAPSILYLADNAGEIVFDRVLIKELLPAHVTVVVRGSPVINDATMVDAYEARLQDLAEVIGNGSDAPGTLLSECSPEFRCRFDAADLVIAKGQGNFETLSQAAREIFFLFWVKCPVIAADAQVPLGSHVLLHHRPDIVLSPVREQDRPRESCRG